MKRILIVTVLIVFYNTIYSQGFYWDSRMESHHKKFSKVGLSRSAVLPSSYSLEKYLPHTMNQGQSGMCAAYSLATCRTILYARNNDLTDIDIISSEAYSPYYIYYKYKHTMGEDWDGGLGLYTDRINQFGYAKMKDIEYPFYYPFTEQKLWDFSLPSYLNLDIEAVKDDKFDKIYSIYASENATDPDLEIITQMKTELSKKHPILFGFWPLPESFNHVGYNNYWSDTIKVQCMSYYKKWEGKWLADEKCSSLTNNAYGICDRCRPSDYEESSGHAMVVIAYDDERYGGSFQILNSWGPDWGDNGKVWISYLDFVKYSYGIQSFDKEKKSIFSKKEKKKSKQKKELNFPDVEIGLKTKDFSSNINFDWIMFAQMTIDGGEYKGKMDQGLKNGRGTYTLPNGIRYEGNWAYDKMHGEGKLTYQDKYEYKGEFKDGSFNGYGVLIRYDGFGHIIEKSDGKFENGKFIEGYLIKDINRGYWKGFRYEGDFEDSDINGNGIMISYRSGEEYEGFFSYGLCDKNGIIKTASGIYEGEWRYSVPYGRGTWKGTDGSIESGIWDGWKIVDE